MPVWLLALLELASVGMLLTGVALVFPPAALILAGVLGIVACEYHDRRRLIETSRRGGAKAETAPR